MNWRVDSCNFRCLLQEMWKLPEVTHKPVGLNILNWMTWAHFSDMKNLPPSVCLIGLSNSSLLPFRRSLLIPLSLSLFGRIKAHPCHPIGQSGLTDSRVQLLDTGSCPRHHRWSSHAGPSEWQAPAEPFTPGAAEKKTPLLHHRLSPALQTCTAPPPSFLLTPSLPPLHNSTPLSLNSPTLFLFPNWQQIFPLFLCLSSPFHSSSRPPLILFSLLWYLVCQYKLLLIFRNLPVP